MIFVIDSGSTKSDWIAIDPLTGKQVFEKQRTKGLNPAIISNTDAFEIIKSNSVKFFLCLIFLIRKLEFGCIP